MDKIKENHGAKGGTGTIGLKERGNSKLQVGSNPQDRFKSQELPWAEYLRTAEMAEGTRAEHFRYLSGLMSLSGQGFDPVSPLAIQTYLLNLLPTARARAYGVFKRFFRFAAIQGWIPYDPLPAVKPPPQPQACRQGLDPDTLASWLGALDRCCAATRKQESFSALRLRLMVNLTLAYGVRVGQHLLMESSAYQADSHSLLVPPKTPRHLVQRLALSEDFRDPFRNYLVDRSHQVCSTARLWITYFGQPLTFAAVARQVEHVCELAEIPRFSGLHLLRHTVSRFLVEEGCSLFEVQAYLGHKSVTTTDSYLRSHFPQAHYDARRVIESKLARLHSPAGPGEAAGAGTDKPPAPELPRKGNKPCS